MEGRGLKGIKERKEEYMKDGEMKEGERGDKGIKKER